jgi:hypothetical protein
MRVASGKSITTMVVARSHPHLIFGWLNPSLAFHSSSSSFLFIYLFIILVLKSEGYYKEEDRKFVTCVAPNQFSIQIDSSL